VRFIIGLLLLIVLFAGIIAFLATAPSPGSTSTDWGAVAAGLPLLGPGLVLLVLVLAFAVWRSGR